MRESLFHSLQLSFNRPAGIGAIVTLMEIIGSMSEKKGDKYIVDADIFEAAVENGKISQRTIDIFSGIDFIVDLDLKLHHMTCDDIKEMVEKIVKKHNGKIKISNITDYSDLSRDPVTKVHLKISLPAESH